MAFRDYESTNVEAAAYYASDDPGPDLDDRYEPDPPAYREFPDSPCGVARGRRVIGGCGKPASWENGELGFGALWHPACLEAHINTTPEQRTA